MAIYKFFTSNGIEFLELLLFQIVVYGGDGDDDHDGDKNRYTLNPSLGDTLSPDTENQGDYGCGAEDLEHLVLEVLDRKESTSRIMEQKVLGGLTIGLLIP